MSKYAHRWHNAAQCCIGTNTCHTHRCSNRCMAAAAPQQGADFFSDEWCSVVTNSQEQGFGYKHTIKYCIVCMHNAHTYKV